MSASAARSPAGNYRGSSAAERRAGRREALILAAILVYGERGYRNATVKAVCEAAGLTERYFYESFANSEALLAASYKAVTAVLLATLEEVGASTPGDPPDRVRAILARYFQALASDPRSARLFLVEIAGVSDELDRIFAASLDSFGDLIERTFGGSRADPLLRKAVIGGVIHLASDWVARGYVEPIDEVTGAASRLCLVLKKRDFQAC
ncbi:MAG TPA: TetR/AcrR family transcriptional regulator [Allosphingosinicella sp.]